MPSSGVSEDSYSVLILNKYIFKTFFKYYGVCFYGIVKIIICNSFRRKRDSSFKTTSYKENIFNYTISGAKGAKLGSKSGGKI